MTCDLCPWVLALGLSCVAHAEIVDGQFSITGSDTAARFFHRAGSLADGRVLVSGGMRLQFLPPSLISLGSLSVYDPGAGVFSAAGVAGDAPQQPHPDHAARWSRAHHGRPHGRKRNEPRISSRLRRDLRPRGRQRLPGARDVSRPRGAHREPAPRRAGARRRGRQLAALRARRRPVDGRPAARAHAKRPRRGRAPRRTRAGRRRQRQRGGDAGDRRSRRRREHAHDRDARARRGRPPRRTAR